MCYVPLFGSIVLDLGGDGVKTTSAYDNNVYFNYEDNGFAQKTGWVSAEDGLLAYDADNNGKVNLLKLCA